MQRQAIKKMLSEWNTQKPGRVESIFTSIQNVVPSHLLDTNAFEFEHLGAVVNAQALDTDAWLLGTQD